MNSTSGKHHLMVSGSDVQTCKNKVLGGNGGQRKTLMINDHQVTNNDHRPQHYDGIIVGFGGWMFLVDFALSYLGESIFNIFNALFMVDD